MIELPINAARVPYLKAHQLPKCRAGRRWSS